MSDFLKYIFLGGGGGGGVGDYQNLSCSILTRIERTNTFSHFPESFRSLAIIKIKIKKLDGDYKYFVKDLSFFFSENL